jgi:hypothetical protein
LADVEMSLVDSLSELRQSFVLALESESFDEGVEARPNEGIDTVGDVVE